MEKRRSKWSLLTNGYLILVLLFIYLPIGYVVLFSFNESKSLTNFTGFSLRWYENMMQDETMLQSIYYTLLTAVIATAVSTVVGTVAAIGLSKARPLVRSLILEVNNLPVMNPDIVTAIGLMLLFISTKIQLSLTTLILAHITFCVPYVILTVMPKLRQLDDNVAEAALDLGATPFQALTKVILPQIYPAILSGALIAFSMSFDDFVISFFTAGVGINNISMYVYSMKRYNPSVNALSTLIVVVVTLILVAVNIIPRLKDRKNNEEEDM
ncbi:MAG: ABC transporter permease [Clostridia bacterium]|nr:ABC transporter permease [Clostridia bacterium]